MLAFSEWLAGSNLSVANRNFFTFAVNGNLVQFVSSHYAESAVVVYKTSRP